MGIHLAHRHAGAAVLLLARQLATGRAGHRMAHG
jgi:hypothetical protein